jgi:hypothetical protein
MKQADQPSKIAFVSDYLPRRCGIATFTHDLRGAVAAEYPDAECAVLAINDVPEGYDYGQDVQFEIQEHRLRDYQEAVNFLRFNIYLDNGNEEKIIADYGNTIIPAMT